MSDAGAAETWHRKVAIDCNDRGRALAERAPRTRRAARPPPDPGGRPVFDATFRQVPLPG